MLFLAGLLTCPSLKAFPSAKRQWLGVYSKILKDLQQRVCSGFAPDSLFIILSMKYERYETKNRCKGIKNVI